jgi:uracil phosphoribosyltransferase
LFEPEVVNVKLQTGTIPPLNVTVHKVVEVVVSVKTTDPVGLAAPANAGVTVAVKATDWLTAEGEGEDVTAVVVLVAATTSGAAVAAVRPEKFASPL